MQKKNINCTQKKYDLRFKCPIGYVCSMCSSYIKPKEKQLTLF